MQFSSIMYGESHLIDCQSMTKISLTDRFPCDERFSRILSDLTLIYGAFLPRKGSIFSEVLVGTFDESESVDLMIERNENCLKNVSALWRGIVVEGELLAVGKSINAVLQKIIYAFVFEPALPPVRIVFDELIRVKDNSQKAGVNAQTKVNESFGTTDHLLNVLQNLEYVSTGMPHGTVIKEEKLTISASTPAITYPEIDKAIERISEESPVCDQVLKIMETPPRSVSPGTMSPTDLSPEKEETVETRCKSPKRGNEQPSEAKQEKVADKSSSLKRKSGGESKSLVKKDSLRKCVLLDKPSEQGKSFKKVKIPGGTLTLSEKLFFGLYKSPSSNQTKSVDSIKTESSHLSKHDLVKKKKIEPGKGETGQRR